MSGKAMQSMLWMNCGKVFIDRFAFKPDVRTHVEAKGVDRPDCFVVALCIRCYVLRPGKSVDRIAPGAAN